MRLLSNIKGSARSILLSGAIIGAAVLGVGTLTSHNAAAACNGDNDSNAVIRCGVSSAGDVQAAAANDPTVQKIFSCMGISKSDVANLKAGTVEGVVTKGGDVLVNGKVVATGALTGGRQNMPGSTNKTSACGTSFYERNPSVSFQQNQLSAIVKLDGNGVFQFAIINSCGNPVIAAPKAQPNAQPKTPDYTINKTVAQKGSGNFVKSLDNLAPGTHVIYHITVKSTGDAAVQNLKVNDVLQSHLHYVNGTLTRDGNSVSSSAFFGNGVIVNSLAPGDSTVFKFEAIVGSTSENTGTCSDETLNNTGEMTATNLPKKTSKATVSKKCQPLPQCTNLDISASGSDNRTIKVTSFSFQANNNTYTSAVVNWGDGSKTNAITNSKQVVGQSHTFAKLDSSKTYIVRVNVSFKLQNGKSYTTPTTPACERQVTITPGQPPKITTPPSELTNTGPGATIGLFAAVSTTAAVAHHVFLRRKLAS